MKTKFGKLVLSGLILALILAALPFNNTYAAGLGDTSTPPAPGKELDPTSVNTRLENVFARQALAVARIGRAIGNFDRLTTRAQKMIDLAREKGLDVAALQNAFDAFKNAFPKGQPIYEKAKSIADTHSGFDSLGKVTDTENAKTTVSSLAATLKEYRGNVGEFFRALREAIRAFRQANPRPTPSPKASPAPANG